MARSEWLRCVLCLVRAGLKLHIRRGASAMAALDAAVCRVQNSIRIARVASTQLCIGLPSGPRQDGAQRCRSPKADAFMTISGLVAERYRDNNSRSPVASIHLNWDRNTWNLTDRCCSLDISTSTTLSMRSHRRTRASTASSVNNIHSVSRLCSLAHHRSRTAVFRVADLSKRGLVSWEDFTVFETCESYTT